ncbi:phage tail sheath C-terminal domain-containing protein [Cohnella sp. WQ 127256]|uniref:phage tail sheath C-terminal domain-containing protein n=1 Tax=Cohnella sp. WQ 127256 TaxID=2938790 RepID=UPI0021190EC1|nr:phage tail sheath C-terminal domain-containing protein [Cohnella sp. WQ 127256]
MAIGLPKIEITFSSLAASAVTRSSRGIVGLIIKDDTDDTFNIVEYKNALEIDQTAFTADNLQYINETFNGTPSKVVVVRVDTASTKVVADAIEALGMKKVDWIGLAEGTTAEQTALATYVNSQEALKKTIKAIVFNATSPDSEHVVTLVNPSVTYKDGTTATGDKYIARLLGLFAGLTMTQSGTYKVLPELASVTMPVGATSVDEIINAGKLVLINDEEVVRVGRAVNSLVTVGTGKSEEWKKIIVVETMDLIRADIYSTFKADYLSKYKNKYDNQVLFISAINSYFRQLANEDILDPEYTNIAFVDVEAQREAWLSIGKTEAETWDDATVKKNTYRNDVFLSANIKILDAIEDIKFNISLF